MEDLAVFTAISHSGSFGKNLVKFKNNKYVIYKKTPCISSQRTIMRQE